MPAVLPTPPLFAPWSLSALDIWDPFDYTGVASGWLADTWANFITGVDANLATQITAGSVVKTDLGASSNSDRHIYKYVAGEGAAHVLLSGTTHGDHKISVAAAMRWFEQFVKNGSPQMQYLRKALKVTWVPSFCPSGYKATRLNANSVDINRNFPFFWDWYVAPSAQFAKGSTVNDQPETVIAMSLVTGSDPPLCLVDCHDGNGGTGEFTYGGPSPFVLGSRQLAMVAASWWQSTYNNSGNLTLVPNEFNDEQPPLFHNWFAYYQRWQADRVNAASVLIDPDPLLLSSTSTNVTRNAMKAYCGFITMYLLAWLAHGQMPAPAYPVIWTARRSTDDSGTAIGSGGTLINNGTNTALTFDAITPDRSTSNRDYLDIPYVYPMMVVCRADGYLESDGATARVDVMFEKEGASKNESASSIQVPATSGQRVPFVCTYVTAPYDPDGVSIDRYRLMFQRISGTGQPNIKRCRVTIEAFPHRLFGQAVPYTNPLPA